jgi:hypothetical protein
MSYYSAGLASAKSELHARAMVRHFIPSKYKQGITVGLIIAPNTDEVLNEMNELNADIASTGKQLFDKMEGLNRDDPLVKWFVDGPWGNFVVKWKDFYSDNKGFWSRFISTTGIYNSTQDFRKEFLGMRDIAESKFGMHFLDNPHDPKDKSDLWGSFEKFMKGIGKYFVYGAIAVGAILILWIIVSLVRK